MTYLDYKLRAAGVSPPRTAAVWGGDERLRADMIEELRLLFPAASIHEEPLERNEPVDLYAYVVEHRPRGLPRAAIRAISRRRWVSLVIVDARTRLAEAVPRSRWTAWRLSLAVERGLAPLFLLIARARAAR